jgi:hypothetical protein
MVNPKIKDWLEYIENAEDPQVVGYFLSKKKVAVAAMG